MPEEDLEAEDCQTGQSYESFRPHDPGSMVMESIWGVAFLTSLSLGVVRSISQISKTVLQNREIDESFQEFSKSIEYAESIRNHGFPQFPMFSGKI